MYTYAVVISRTVELLLDPYFDLRHDIRVLMKEIIFIVTHVREADRRRQLSNRVSRIAHRRLNFRISEIDSPLVVSFPVAVRKMRLS